MTDAELDKAERVAAAVYLATDFAVADEVANTIYGLVKEVRRLRKPPSGGDVQAP